MKTWKYLLLIIMLLPINIYAYSNKIVIGGETIGISVYSKGVYIVGFYDVNGENIASKAGFQVGDIIQEIDGVKIENVETLTNILGEDKEYTFSILRGNQTKKISLKLLKEDNYYKTGLYVKDQITGIGTLSYVDPETKVFASLGHDILESNSLSHFLLKDGAIYKAEVSSIKKSTRGNAGEKSAIINKNQEIGKIEKNEINGIYGIYSNDLEDKDLITVGEKNEIQRGEATIRTVIKDNKIEDFSIDIMALDEADSTKNILFEITDKKLLENTGGIVQGMSGSPIIQNNKIIGVVNYVIVDDATKGYGIFIETMLKEGDKILSSNT